MITIEFGAAIAIVTIGVLLLLRHAAKILTAIRADSAQMRRNSDQATRDFAALCRNLDPRRQHIAQMHAWAANHPGELTDLCEQLYDLDSTDEPN